MELTKTFPIPLKNEKINYFSNTYIHYSAC